MPYVDTTQIPENEDFPLIPDGIYPCTVIFSEDSKTRKDFPMILLTLQIDGGEYHGRYIFDRLIFSEGGGMKRMNLVSQRLGVYPKGYKGEINAAMYLGKRARVTVETSEYEGKKRNKVTFDGYEAINRPPPPEIDKTDDVPF